MIKIWIVIDGKYFILMNILFIHHFDISYYSYEKSYTYLTSTHISIAFKHDMGFNTTIW